MLMGATVKAHVVVTGGTHDVIASSVFVQGGATMRTRFRVGELQRCDTIIATVDSQVGIGVKETKGMLAFWTVTGIWIERIWWSRCFDNFVATRALYQRFILHQSIETIILLNGWRVRKMFSYQLLG
jgi:hypothetical protein